MGTSTVRARCLLVVDEERLDGLPVVNASIEPGSIWRAKSCFAKVDAIRIVGLTNDRRVFLVEWVEVGSEIRMTAESILSGYTLADTAEP